MTLPACASREDQARGRDVEADAEEREQQQQRREAAEVERIGGVQRHQQHDQRQPDAGGEAQVEQDRRQRHHDQRDDENDGDGECDFGALARFGASNAIGMVRRSLAVLMRPPCRASGCRTAHADASRRPALRPRRDTSRRESSVPTLADAMQRAGERHVLDHGHAVLEGEFLDALRDLALADARRSYGAGATSGSYLMATAMCIGFTITTSALGTAANICATDALACRPGGDGSSFPRCLPATSILPSLPASSS